MLRLTTTDGYLGREVMTSVPNALKGGCGIPEIVVVEELWSLGNVGVCRGELGSSCGGGLFEVFLVPADLHWDG